MSQPFELQTRFTLDRSHFNECYSQSLTQIAKPYNYTKSAVVIVIGVVLLFFTELDNYFSSFIIGLGVIEALSVRYQQAWWVTRQMLSRVSNSEITLTINQQGVTTKSFLATKAIPWQDIIRIVKTEKGIILIAGREKHYLSNQCLSEQAKQYILSHTA